MINEHINLLLTGWESSKGSVRVMAQITRMSEKTIRRGLEELRQDWLTSRKIESASQALEGRRVRVGVRVLVCAGVFVRVGVLPGVVVAV